MGEKVKVRGEQIYLTDSTNNPIVDFSLYGKAEQTQYSGKNLCEFGNVSGTKFVTKNLSIPIPAGTYTISAIATSNDTDSNLSAISVLSNGVWKRDLRFEKNVRSSNTITTDYEITSLSFYASVSSAGSEGDTFTFSNIQIEAGSTMTDFEPYVGGIASPNPEYPQEITVSGSDGSVEVKSVGKNLFGEVQKKALMGSVEEGFYVDNSLKNGRCFEREIKPNTQYTITPYNNKTFRLILSKKQLSGSNSLDKNALELINVKIDAPQNLPKTYTFNSGDYTFCTLALNNSTNTDISNDLKAQLEVGTVATEFQEHTETSSTIPTPNGLCGIKVSSGGNYVDENGQQWLCDEIVKYADGSGKRIERIKHYSLAVTDMNNSEDFPGWLNVEDLAEVFGSGRNEELTSQLLINVGNRFSINTDSNLIFLRKSVYNLTQTEWKTKYPDLIVEIYAMRATPIITDLSAEEIAEIEKLYTFYPITNISNDADCGMILTYFSTKLEFLEPKTDWTRDDAFDYVAYNRVTNNIMYLKELANYLFSRLNEFNLETEKDNLSLIYARHMNDIENGLESINLTTYKIGIGEKKTYKPNGNVPNYKEYNRIESACLALYNEMQIHKANLPRLAFRLGNQKGIMV